MMKKNSFIIVLFFILCMTAGAQTQTTTVSNTVTTDSKSTNFYSKRGVYFFPVAGEFAIGIDALPLFRYAGNLLATRNTNDPSFDYASNFSGYTAVYGKYFLTDKKAIRIRLGLKDAKTSDLYPVILSSLTPDASAPAYDNDKVETFDRSFYLAAGLEKRRGNSRIQGVYGAEVIFGFSQYITNYLYANSINADFNSPATYNGSGYTQRITKDRTTQSFEMAARCFAGVEYFFAPKVSIGGEFGYSLKFQNNGIRQQTYEYWNSATSSVSTITNNSSYNSFKFIGLTTDNLSGSINLFFYF